MAADFYAWDEIPDSIRELLTPIVNRVISTKNAGANPLGVSFHDFGRDYYVAAKYNRNETVLHISEKGGECRFVGGVIINPETWKRNGLLQ